MASFMAFPYAGDATMRATVAGELEGIAVAIDRSTPVRAFPGQHRQTL